jgi:hypothetical protein
MTGFWKIVGWMLSTGFGLAAYTGVKKAIGNRQQALGGEREIAAVAALLCNDEG